MKQALALSRRHGRLGALLFVDLDYFKAVKDRLGQDIGDALLQKVASRSIRVISRHRNGGSYVLRLA